MDTDLQPGGLEADLIVDRDAASRLGLTESQIDNALGDAFAQAQVSTIYNPFSPQQYHVVMEVAPEFWQNPDVLKELYVSTSGGAVTGTQATQAVAGTTSFKSAQRSTPATRRRRGCGAQPGGQLAGECRARQHLHRLRRQRRGGDRGAVFGLQPFRHRHHAGQRQSHRDVGLDLHRLQPARRARRSSTALAAIERTMARDPHAHQHPRRHLRHRAAVPAEQRATQPLMLLAALVAIYVVLGVLYESYSQPLTILSTLPSAGVGALLALMATGTEFSLIAFLGIMLLIGIVKKNAIMMVDFALEAERNLGLDPRDAIAHACSLRFRPIMMTTCAAIAGALPLAIAYRRRHRDAPPAGHFHRRRPDRQPAADALHHAGGLPVCASLLEALEARQVQPPPAPLHVEHRTADLIRGAGT